MRYAECCREILHDYPLAIHYLQRTIQEYPNDFLVPEAIVNLVYTYHGYQAMDSTTRWAQCNKYLDQCLTQYAQSTSPFMPLAYYWKGYLQQFAYHNCAGAIEFYQKEVTLWPQDKYSPRAQFDLGQCYYNLGDYPNALMAYQKFIQNYPQHGLVSLVQQCIGTIQGRMNPGK
jgi:tetratricopeptide (TPR) repeat protein